MRDVALILVGVFMLGMGVYALAMPAALVRPFGIAIESAVSRSEIRAVYGGFGLAMAGLLFWTATGDDQLRNGAALTVGVALGGMAAGRLLSRILDEGTSFYPIWFYFLVEVAAAALVIGVVV
ncbi:DUF4345 domain-containing protein [Mycobacterium sp. NPDC050853]|uniref:DUF4345 domain-containing protein n=1 Tax=Mycobacteriaceae TaxID=1762 RepID=UPI0015DFE087|nr:DUF4345 domain-containing protein [Mycobacteroides sp. LB1]